MLTIFRPLLLAVILPCAWVGPGPGVLPGGSFAAVCAPCIRADMNFLADDAMHGRGSATRDEHIAALYVAAQFEQLGLTPGGDASTFLQKAPLPHPLPQRVTDQLKGYEATPRTETWNAVALLRGTDSPSIETLGEAILLTAHLDHLGIGPAVAGDTIYNGADDDASGTAAVLALARAFAAGKRPRRTIVFALFGSEEIGGYGVQYFLEHPPVPLDHLVIDLEFEMIGRPDPAVAAGKLWLTGYERSNLGPALAEHGALIAADPHPAQKFFQRSDNYTLAKRGIIAHTVSSFNLHKDYHRPSDELSRIDFEYMTNVIGSMIAPVEWLANSTFKPVWMPGGKP